MFGFTWEDVLRIAHDAEAGGFRNIWLSDHLFLGDRISLDCLETWSTLAAIAACTTKIRIGAMVTCQTYRNPALLAKIAASIDRISGGRLDFGIGAGWKENEYLAYGYDFPATGVRIDQLAETLEICTRLWTEERATFHGTHYRIDDAPCSPKPLQQPLPVWIGGGKPRIMRLAAKWAHGFNYLTGGFPTADRVAPAMRELDDVCRAVGRDPKSLRRSVVLFVIVARSRAEVDAIVAEQAQFRGPVAAWRANGFRTSADSFTATELLSSQPQLIAGTPDEVRDRLKEYAAAGADDANLRFAYRHERAMTQLFGTDVMPALQ